MISRGSAPPIVLVYGLWLHPRSWEGWKQRFERRGHQVLAPPGRAGWDSIRSCTSP